MRAHTAARRRLDPNREPQGSVVASAAALTRNDGRGLVDHLGDESGGLDEVAEDNSTMTKS